MRMQVDDSMNTMRNVIAELNEILIGQSDIIEKVTIALLTGGHVLVEGVPGTGKTLLINALSHIVGAKFNRVQFTPDLMPTDIIGVNIYDGGMFKFREGPVFTDFFLADEINRAPAKTQSSLLEAMEEMQVTVDGVTYDMSKIFSVFATQNPVELEGTYPLPEAQVDRFMFKVIVDYPSEEDENVILDKVESGFDSRNLENAGIKQHLDVKTLIDLRREIRTLHVEEDVRRYVTRIVRSTRSSHNIMLGASPRAGVMLLLAAKGKAFLEGRSFVTPDDVKAMAFPVLRHRIILEPEAEVEGRKTDDSIRDLLVKIDVPR